MACDVKELFPGKRVVLVHSRETLMPVYHEALSGLIRKRFEELGVELVTGSRAVVPEGGFPVGVGAREVRLQDGRVVTGELVIPATGQTPNTGFVAGLEAPAEPGALINPRNGFIRVRPTMQFGDARYPHLFAVGDIADSGAHKAARPGMAQAAAAARNIASMVAGREATETMSLLPAGIHLTLGLVSDWFYGVVLFGVVMLTILFNVDAQRHLPESQHCRRRH
jgi:NADPH-dependent 2,4-dienoyl-CoA reductase/sulfur reductase-like enzyme